VLPLISVRSSAISYLLAGHRSPRSSLASQDIPNQVIASSGSTWLCKLPSYSSSWDGEQDSCVGMWVYHHSSCDIPSRIQAYMSNSWYQIFQSGYKESQWRYPPESIPGYVGAPTFSDDYSYHPFNVSLASPVTNLVRTGELIPSPLDFSVHSYSFLGLLASKNGSSTDPYSGKWIGPGTYTYDFVTSSSSLSLSTANVYVYDL